MNFGYDVGFGNLLRGANLVPHLNSVLTLIAQTPEECWLGNLSIPNQPKQRLSHQPLHTSLMMPQEPCPLGALKTWSRHSL
jgi:hypothetical protein